MDLSIYGFPGQNYEAHKLGCGHPQPIHQWQTFSRWKDVKSQDEAIQRVCQGVYGSWTFKDCTKDLGRGR
jgi:hypothetical protein